MSCEKCVEWEKQLDARNIATRVWVQSDTQTREYAIRMAREAGALSIENAQLKADIVKLKADWNTQARFWNATSLRDTKYLQLMHTALSKLSKGWLYWPTNRQPDPRVTMYESRSLDEIEKMSKEVISIIKRECGHE
jgi:hypothetical protein